MRYQTYLSLFTIINFVFCFSDQLYDKFIHYAKYTALSSCITHGNLSEGWFNKGACTLKFCYDGYNAGAKVIKIRHAKENESGTGFITLDTQNKEIIISFRGSVTRTDWASDLQMFKVDYKSISNKDTNIPECDGCKVHYGFFKNLREITESFTSLVDELFSEYNNYNLIITGHSLGAALAVLVGIEFKVRGYNPLILAYASPRLFNPQMANWVNDIFQVDLLNEKIEKDKDIDFGLIRLVHDEDFVPMLPPTFRPAGVEFFIKKMDLPHLKNDVDYRGANYIEITNKKRQRVFDLLHAYEHRTYFMTINKCENF